MGKDFKRRFTVSLDIGTKDAEKQIKSTVGNLKTILADLGSASDKMTYFKELADYLSQVDTQLDSLRQKYGEGIFNQMFGGLDENLRKQMEATFGVAREQLLQLEQLKEKVAAAKNNGITTGADLKPLEQEVRSLYESIGMLDKLDLSGKGKVETRIKKLEAALNGFAVVWDGVNDRVKQGFNFGQQNSSDGFDDKVKKEIEKLESQAAKYQSILDKINEASAMVQASDSGKTITLGFKVTEEEARKLVNRLQELDDEAKNLDKSSAKYAENLAERAKIAVQLREMDIKLTKTNKYSEVTKQSPDFLKDALRSLGNNALNDFANQSKNVLSIVSNAIDEITNKISQIKNVGASGGQSDLNDELTLSYDKLKEKVQEYYALLDERSNNPTKERKAEIQALQGEIQDEISGLVDESQQGVILDIFDEIDGKTIKIEEAISEFANALGIIPDKFQKISKSASDAEKPVQSIMYHLGNLLNGSGARDTFDQMPYNLTEAANGTRYEKYGFGALGGGLFGVTNPATIDQVPGGSRFIQSIDISKYNMYMADTEERATNLIDFLSKLQKFSIKQAESNYTGFDKQLEGVNIDSLYQQFKVLFEQSDLTKEKLQEFISEMVNLLQQAGLYFDKDTNILDFSSIGNLQGADNISTRFMKMLGYQGVNVGTTSLDGLGQGSVLFNFDKSDIVGYFNTIEQAVKDYENLANQIDGNEWTGSIEQLQQYKQNVDDIINRLQQFKSTDIGMAQSESIEKTINRLEQVKTTIDKTISGNGQSSFVAITNSIDQAEAKVREFLALADEIQNKSFDNAWDATDNVEIGKYTERLNATKAALDALGDQGLLTAEQLEQVNNAFDQATGVLSSRTKTYDAYASGSSSTYDYYDEYERERDKADQLEQENESLREQLSKKQQTTEEYTNAENASLERNQQLKAQEGTLDANSSIIGDMSQELNQLDELHAKLIVVKEAIDAKTKAFEEEYVTVDAAIDAEVQSLQLLLEKLQEVLNKINLVSESFTKANTEIAELKGTKEVDVKENITSETIVNKAKGIVSQDYALDTTLLKTNGILNQILAAIGNNESLAKMVEPLNAAVAELKNVANGIVQEQKARKSDTSVAQARIANNDSYTQIKSIALGSLGDRALDSDVTQMKALANGIVQVTGWIKTAENEWEGFTVKVNEAGKVTDLLYEKNTKAAKAAAVAAAAAKNAADGDEDANIKTYNRAEVEKRAQKHLDELTAQGKKATVQFKDSGRYTITILEEIDGLSKQIFQTFDENDDKIERTTATISNDQKIKLENLKSLIETGVTDSLVSDKDTVYQQYQKANEELEKMNSLYRAKDNLENEDIAIWNAQIKLVQQLASDVEKLIQKRKVAIESKAFKSDRSKKLSKYDLDLADLKTKINIPDSFNQQLEDARKAIESAADSESLKIAVNNWETLKNQIKQTATEQDLFIKKSKETKDTTSDKFTKDLDKQKNVFAKYKVDLGDVSKLSQETQQKLAGLETALNNISDTNGLNQWVKNFSDLKTEIANAQKIAQNQKSREADTIAGQANTKFKELDFKTDAVSVNTEQQKLLNLRKKLIDAVDEYKIKVNSGQDVEISGLKQIQQELFDAINAYKQKNNIINVNGKSQKAYGTSAVLSATGKYNMLKEQASNAEFDGSGEIAKRLNQYTAAYQKLLAEQKKVIASQNQLKPGESLTNEQLAGFKQAQMECNKYATELNKLIAANKKFEESAQNVTKVDEDFVDTAEGRMKALQDFVQVQYGATAEIGKFDAACEKLTFTVDNGNGTFTQMTAAINPARNAIGAMVGDVKEATSAFGQFFNELKGKVRSIFMYLASSMSLQEVWQQLRQGVNYVREIDSALTELKKVTDETDASYSKFLKTMSQAASVVGSTTSELTTSAADWARLNI